MRDGSPARWSLAVGLALAAALASLSGTLRGDPRTPPAAPGLPEPFLGTAVLGSGGLSGAVDAYGSVVDLRYPGPAGEAEISNGAGRQRLGSVPADTGVVLAAAGDAGPVRPLWRASGLRQRYVRNSNVLVTAARVGRTRLTATDAIDPRRAALARRIELRAGRGERPRLHLGLNFDLGGRALGDAIRIAGTRIVQTGGARRVVCRLDPPPQRARLRNGDDAKAVLAWRGRTRRLSVALVCGIGAEPPQAAVVIRSALASDRRWLERARPLAADAPGWARAMYRRSLLVLRALTDRRSGAEVAGARDFWAHVWPRDASTGAMALAAAGYRSDAGRVTGFLSRLDLAAGARFDGAGRPVADGRPAAGDAPGWVRAAMRAAEAGRPLDPPAEGLRARDRPAERFPRAPNRPAERFPRAPNRPAERLREAGHSDDYWETGPGDYLANAIAAGSPEAAVLGRFGGPEGLHRRAGDPASGLDSAAAWAIVPFARPGLWPVALATLRRLAGRAGRFGLTPGEGWSGRDPWTAETGSAAWALAAAGDRRGADLLLTALRRATTPAGTLPERLDRRSGIARSTTPLAWSHAAAILALRARYAATRRP